jgi:hypothetical protein
MELSYRESLAELARWLAKGAHDGESPELAGMEASVER